MQMSTADNCPSADSCSTQPEANASIGRMKRPEELNRNIDVSSLVDSDGGLIDRAIYSEPAIYAQEQRRIFASSWLFLAHTSQFKKPGDFFTTFMGEDPIIVTMDKTKKIRA